MVIVVMVIVSIVLLMVQVIGGTTTRSGSGTNESGNDSGNDSFQLWRWILFEVVFIGTRFSDGFVSSVSRMGKVLVSEKNSVRRAYIEMM